ncbi:Phosphoribosyl-AMP cyclohydrolase [hydrothermal vent metagenome]|uniref:Histidine biosynthesis bifunctional protein HisIE n=1 Tax=hydrothermal vent metagenome TaxID=652676 RepID=A0A1W1CPN6_9ZZZZ
MPLLEKIKFDDKGLIPVIAQDVKTNEILMFAWMNKEALELSLKNNQAVYYSRSRQKLWFKGEESGYNQTIKEFYLDCDRDVLLIKIEQKGGISCHTGRKSCFFQKIEKNKITITQNVLKKPTDIYG